MIQVVSGSGLSRGGSTDEYLFHQGTLYSAYRYLGCQRAVSDGSFFYTFRTWAPRADEVRLISDFTDWERGLEMKRVTEKGVYEVTVRSDVSLSGSVYKYLVVSGGVGRCKGDPYALASKGECDGGGGDDAEKGRARPATCVEQGADDESGASGVTEGPETGEPGGDAHGDGGSPAAAALDCKAIAERGEGRREAGGHETAEDAVAPIEQELGAAGGLKKHRRRNRRGPARAGKPDA